MALDPLDEIRFLMQTHADAQRTLICDPDLVHAVRAAVGQAGAASIFTVQGSPVCPPGRIVVLDEQALEASWRQTVQGFARGIRVSGRGNDPSWPSLRTWWSTQGADALRGPARSAFRRRASPSR